MKSSLLKKFINLTLRFPSARALYTLVSPLWNGFSATPSYPEACKLLEDFHPDCGHSPLAPPKPLPDVDYDLLVVVAAYNVAEYIEECIDSIISQHTDYRVLIRIVNDASTDSTAAILAQYAHIPNVEIITHPTNQGLSAARNTALANLNAIYICNVDGDDKLAPGSLDRWLRRAFESDADIVVTGQTRFDTVTGHTVSSISPVDANSIDIDRVEGQPTFFLYRRELFRDVVYPIGYWFEDVIFELLFFPKAKKIASASGTNYLYRLRCGSITQSLHSTRNLGSLYGGAKSIISSVEAGCWSEQHNRQYLTSLCAHIVRITNARLLYQPAIIRKSAMVYWQQAVSRIIPLLSATSEADRELFQAILDADYARFENNCIAHHRWH